MAAAGALTEPDVVALRAEASAGRPVTVWFTAAAVGVPAGGSAKVVSVGEPAEGDFIQVRAAGTRDTMFCSPGELTRTRPVRRRAAAPSGKPAPPSAPGRAAGTPADPGAQPARAAVTRPASGSAGAAGSTGAAGPTGAARSTGSAAAGPAAPTRTAAPVAAPVGTAPVGTAQAAAPAGTAPAADAEPGPKPGRAARARRRSDPTGELSVNLTATADGEWTAEVRVGTKRVVAALPVPAADVATAARSLPAAVAEAIEASVEGARQRQRDRVEQLRAELDAAQQVLDQLGS